MDKERNKVSYITAFLRGFATIFTLTVLVMSLVGKIITNYDHEIQNMSTIFALGGAGLPYATILQIAVFSMIMSAVSKLLFSDYFVVRIPFIWRYFIFFLATLFTASIFSIVFKWFPVDNLQAWLSFILALFTCFGISISLSLLILKSEDKKYNKLLEAYKNRYEK